MATAVKKARRAEQKPPDLNYILDLRSELKTLYAEQDEQIIRSRQVRELKQGVPLDADHRLVDIEVRDPTATDEAQRVSATLCVNPPTVTVIPSRPGDKAQKNATLREKWSEEVLKVAGTRMPGLDTFEMATDAAVADGGAWTKVLFSRDLWDARYSLRLADFLDDPEANAGTGVTRDLLQREEGEIPDEAEDEDLEPEHQFVRRVEEAKKTAGPPFYWQPCDSLGIYPVYKGIGLGEMLEEQERPRLATFRQYGLKADKDGNIVPDELGQGGGPDQSGTSESAQTKVNYLEHWTPVWCSVVVAGSNGEGKQSGRIVKQWRHNYGEVPYYPAFGLMMNHWRNRKVGWGVFEAKRWLVEYRSYLWTLHAQIAARDALPPIAEEQTNPAQQVIGGSQTPNKSEAWDLRQIIKLDPGKKLVPINFPQVQQALKEQIALVNEAIERLETPRVQGNIGSGLEGAGFAINQVLSEARIRHNPIAKSIETMIVKVIKLIWKIVRTKVKEKVWVYRESDDAGWLAAGPDDLTDTVSVKVRLDPERPSAKLIEARYWHERLDKGTAHFDQAVEAMGDNPDEIRLGKALDRMRQQPWYLKLQDQYVLDEAGMGDLLEEAQQIAQSGMIPGMPPGVQATPAMAMGGNSGVPDMGALALSPNGQGAAPMGGGPPNGAVPGAGPGAVVPMQSAAPGIQQLAA
jgi:hypothetical protein